MYLNEAELPLPTLHFIKIRHKEKYLNLLCYLVFLKTDMKLWFFFSL